MYVIFCMPLQKSLHLTLFFFPTKILITYIRSLEEFSNEMACKDMKNLILQNRPSSCIMKVNNEYIFKMGQFIESRY